jgi:hypothetical protein
MDEEIDDPVMVIKMIEDIGNQMSALQDELPPMTMLAMSPMGPKQIDVIEDMMDTLDQCRDRILSSYGKMLWESGDGPMNKIINGEPDDKPTKPTVDQSYRQVNVSTMPSEVLAKVFSEARAEAHRKALEDGERVQSSTGDVERKRSRSLVRRLLERASGRTVR